jgi:integrase
VTHAPQYLKDVLRFAYGSGWQRGEIRGLRRDMVDRAAGTITLPYSLSSYIDGSRFFVARSTSSARWIKKTGSDTTRSAATRSLAITAKALSNSLGPRASGLLES